MRKQTKLWKTRDGTKIRICDMEDSHLQNTMKMLERNAHIKADKYLLLALDMEANTCGDVATLTAENAVKEACEDPWESYLLDIYWNMQEEARRRGLVK